MPLYDYRCRSCGHEFEALVRGAAKPECPSCHSADLEQLLSMFAVSSETTRAAALRAGKARQKKMTEEKARADIEEIEHHRH
jgi:putative FmdB family regulatory protein